MPYISRARRDKQHYFGGNLPALEAGDLNFQISRLMNDYIMSKGLSYRIINELVGVLECAKLELYRRIAVPYENQKLAEHGDVYGD